MNKAIPVKREELILQRALINKLQGSTESLWLKLKLSALLKTTSDSHKVWFKNVKLTRTKTEM